MKLPGKSARLADVDITDYYKVRLRPIWTGFKREGAAFWWLCIYFILEYARPQTLYPVIDVAPWTQIALLATCVAAFIDSAVKWTSNRGNVLFILFFLIVIASSIFAFHPSAAWDKIDIIINWVIIYFLMITVVNTEKRFFIFLLVFFLVNFKMSQFGFRSFLTVGYTKFGVSGAPGWFKDSGDLGIQMTIFVSLSTAFFLALQNYWGFYKKLLFSLLPLTGVVTIIATTSRGAQLGMLGAGIWFLIKSPKGVKALLAAIVVGVAVYTLLPDRMLQEYQTAGEDSTSVARLALWDYGLEVAREHPVLGVGYYNWMDYCWYKNPYGIGDDVKHCLVAHNTYITAVAEIGYVGLFMYIVIIVFIFMQNARTRRNAEKTGNTFIAYIAHGLDGGLIAFLISTTFFTVLFYPILWVQLAMTVTLYEISRKQLAEKGTGPP